MSRIVQKATASGTDGHMSMAINIDGRLVSVFHVLTGASKTVRTSTIVNSFHYVAFCTCNAFNKEDGDGRRCGNNDNSPVGGATLIEGLRTQLGNRDSDGLVR